MAKDENVESDAPVIKYEANPETFKTIVLKVHKKLESGEDISADVAPISAGERDAMLLSREFPGESFLTVYNNGIPCTLSVNELIKDVMISILMKED